MWEKSHRFEKHPTDSEVREALEQTRDAVFKESGLTAQDMMQTYQIRATIHNDNMGFSVQILPREL